MRRPLLHAVRSIPVRLSLITMTLACRVNGDAWSGVTLQTDTTAYVARATGPTTRRQYTFTVVARLTNRRGDAISLERCFPDSREPLFDLGAVPGVPVADDYAVIQMCVGHDQPLVVPAHSSRVDTLRITGPTAFGGTPPAVAGSPVGTMRLRYQVHHTNGFERRGPERSIPSNAFTVDTIGAPAGDA